MAIRLVLFHLDGGLAPLESEANGTLVICNEGDIEREQSRERNVLSEQRPGS
jgi:hypothetical protein